MAYISQIVLPDGTTYDLKASIGSSLTLEEITLTDTVSQLGNVESYLSKNYFCVKSGSTPPAFEVDGRTNMNITANLPINLPTQTASKILVTDANKNIVSSSLAESDLITTSNIGSQSVNYATSAGNSQKLGQASADINATASTIVKRDGNGYIYAKYFNQSSGAETPTTSSYAVYCNSDGWFRKSSMANMRTALQVLPLSGGTVTGVLSISRGVFLRWTNTGGQITGGTDNQIYLCASGILGRNYSNKSWVNMAANAFNSQSSRLIKDNIEDMSDDEAKKILDVNVVDFDYNKFYGNNYKNIGRQHGVIAEDVLEIIPSVVSVPDNYNAKEAKEKLKNGEFTSTMGVDYAKFTPYLIKLVQIQQKQIDDLKRRIEG